MVANPHRQPLRGSSFGGSRAPKPTKIVRQLRQKLGSVLLPTPNDKGKGRGLTVDTESTSPTNLNKTAGTNVVVGGDGDKCKIPSPASSAASTINTVGMHGSAASTSSGGSRQYFAAGEYEYELSLQAAPFSPRGKEREVRAAAAAPTSPLSEDGSTNNGHGMHAAPSSFSGLGSIKSLDEAGNATSYTSGSNAHLSPSPPRPPSSCSLSRSRSATATPTPTASAATAATATSATIPIDASLQESIQITPRPIPPLSVRKTIYLIRHAESDENRRQQALYKSLSQMRSLTLPTRADLAASLELVDVTAQIDSDVSAVGRRQIDMVGDQLRADDFVVKEGIQLVVHSPLRRARQTSAGMLGCVAPKVKAGEGEGAVAAGRDKHKEEEAADPHIQAAEAAASVSCGNGGIRRNGSIGAGLGSLLTPPIPPDPTASGQSAPSVSRIVELPALAERTPLEWLPVNHDAFTDRIASFERWLAGQPETVVAVVGHSHYFQCMLGLDYKFGNCDVWRVTYDSSVGLWTCPEEVKQTIRKDYWRQKEENHRRKSERVLKDLEKKREKIQKDIEETRDRVKEDWERLLRQMKIDGYKESDDLAGDSSGIDEAKIQENHSSEETTGASEEANLSGKETSTGELEKEHLPRGWSGLRRLYTYHPGAV